MPLRTAPVTTTTTTMLCVATQNSKAKMTKDHIYCRIHVGLCTALIWLWLFCFHCIHVCLLACSFAYMCVICECVRDINVFVACFPLKPIRERCLRDVYIHIHRLDATLSTALFHHHLYHIAIICRHFASHAVPISVLAAAISVNASTLLLSPFLFFSFAPLWHSISHNLYYSAR